jgi:putative sterol carrier protein
MSLQILTDRIKTILGTDSGLDATAKFVTDEGIVFVDGKSVPNNVSNADLDADFNAMMALMTGKLKIDGDMGVAMKIAETFGGR